MRRFWVSGLLMVLGCKAPEKPVEARAASSVFSPQTTPPLPLADLTDGGLPYETAASPGLVGEIVGKAPKLVLIPTGVGGGTLVGTSTDAKESPASEKKASDASAAPSSSAALLREESPSVSVGIPSPVVERAARAGLYYALVTRCRDAEGKPLPPDAVTLRFKIDTDGLIVPASVSANAEDPRYEAAAGCMRRELSASSFRAPASARGVAAMVNATVPSVD